uniref:Uncharacterized protein n=1 Tax=Bursaphelenchus xylophilus TaxID=6326 RepID=A0A1I7RX44_BURXY
MKLFVPKFGKKSQILADFRSKNLGCFCKARARIPAYILEKIILNLCQVSSKSERHTSSTSLVSRRAMDKMDSKYQSSGKKSALDESMYEGPTLQAMRKRYAAELESSESEEEREKESLLKAGEGRERSRRRSMRVIRQNYEDSTQKLRQQGSQNVKNNSTLDRKIQQRSQSAYEVRCNKAAEWVDKSSAFFDSTVGISAKSNIPKELNEYDLSEWDTLNSVENSFNNEKKRFEGWVKEESGAGEKKAEKKEEKNMEIQVQKPGLKVDEKEEKIAENCMEDAKPPCQKETPLTSPIVVVHRPGGLDVITNNPKYTKTHSVVCEDILKFNYKPFTSGLTNSFGQSWNTFEKPQPTVIKNVEWDLQNSVRKNEKRILPNPGITEAKKSDVISPKSPAESLVS